MIICFLNYRCDRIHQQLEIDFDVKQEGRRKKFKEDFIQFFLFRFHQQRAPSEFTYSLARKPPEFLLDTDGDTTDASNQHQIPPEILYLLKSVKFVDVFLF